MKKLAFWIIGLAIIVFLVAYKWLYLQPPTAQKPLGRPGSGSPLQVSAFITKSATVENQVFAMGTLLASEEVQVIPEIAGKIERLDIQEGRYVSKGRLLVKIQDDELQAQLQKLKQQEQLAIEKEGRQKKLLEGNSISKEEYENSLNTLQVIQADQRILKSQIAKTNILAPFSGTLGFRMLSEGAYVTPGTIISNLYQLDPIKIDFSIPERYAPLIKIGQSIPFYTEGNEDLQTCKIIAIEPKIEEATRNLKVRALAANSKRNLLPGSFARMEIRLKDSDNSIMIPSQALIPILKGYKVFLFRSGKVAESTVKTGLRTETEVQILEGLQAGDTIITSGILMLKPGSPVQLKEIEGHE